MTYIFDRARNTVTIGSSKQGKLENTVALNREAIACFFDLSMANAARCLGVCMTLLKRVRRWHGVRRWPRTTLVAFGFEDVDLKTVGESRRQMIEALRGDESQQRLLQALQMAEELAPTPLCKKVEKSHKKDAEKKASFPFSYYFVCVCLLLLIIPC